MPAALYLGCGNDYIQCCHGGIEIGYTPHALLNQVSDKLMIGLILLIEKLILRSCHNNNKIVLLKI